MRKYVRRPVAILFGGLVLPALLYATVLTSAGSAANKPSSTAATRCTPKLRGGTLTVLTRGAITLDPASPYGSRGAFQGDEDLALYDSLMQYDPKSRKFVPRVAKSLTPNAGYTKWTLKLRKNIKFGDGNPLTAAAVKSSIERNNNPPSAGAPYVSFIKDMTVVNDLTLVFTLASPWPDFPWVLSVEPGMIVDTSVADRLGAQFGLDPAGAGVGPYEFESFIPGEAIVLKAKPHYWGGVVCINEIRFIPNGKSDTAVDQVKSKGADAVILRDQPAFLSLAKNQYRLHVFTDLLNFSVMYWLDNLPTSPTSDVRVRRALAAAIDPNVINERAFSGTGLPTTAIFRRGSIWYQGLAGPKYDPAYATGLVRQLMSEGYRSPDGTVHPWNGTIHIVCTPDRQNQVLAVAAQLQAVGITPNVDLRPQVLSARVTGDYDMVCGGLSVGEAAPQENLAYVSGALTHYQNAAWDATIAQIRRAVTHKAKLVGLAKLQAIWNSDVPDLNLGALYEAVAWNNDVAGLTFGGETYMYFDKAYLTTAARRKG